MIWCPTREKQLARRQGECTFVLCRFRITRASCSLTTPSINTARRVGQGRSSYLDWTPSSTQRSWLGCSRLKGLCARNVFVFTSVSCQWRQVLKVLTAANNWRISSCQSTILSVDALHSAWRKMPRLSMQRIANEKCRQHSNGCYTLNRLDNSANGIYAP